MFSIRFTPAGPQPTSFFDTPKSEHTACSALSRDQQHLTHSARLPPASYERCIHHHYRTLARVIRLGFDLEV